MIYSQFDNVNNVGISAVFSIKEHVKFYQKATIQNMVSLVYLKEGAVYFVHKHGKVL